MIGIEVAIGGTLASGWFAGGWDIGSLVGVVEFALLTHK